MSEKITKYMRIYTRHDFDLMMYYLSLCSCKEAGNREFSRIVKIILRDYINGSKTEIPIVITNVNIIPQGSVRIRFTFDTEKDPGIAELYKKIRPRQANSFLKNLMRSRIAENQLACYFKDSKTAFPAVIEGLNDRKHVSKITENKKESFKPVSKELSIDVKSPLQMNTEINIPIEVETKTDIPLNEDNETFSDRLISEDNSAEHIPEPSGFNFFGALEKAMDFN